MDSNGTHFQLILGAADWSACSDDTDATSSAAEGAPASGTPALGVTWNAVTREETLRPLPFRFAAGTGDRKATLEDRRGAARDRYGNWYWIDPETFTIRVKNTGDGRITDFWPLAEAERPALPAGGFAPTATRTTTTTTTLRFAALTVTTHHYLVVGILEPAG